MGDPERNPRRSGGQPARGTHRGPPARVPRVPRRDPEGSVRRRHDDDLGRGHVRRAQVGGPQGRGHLPRRAAERALRAVPDRQARRIQERLDDPPDGSARGSGPRADARAADPDGGPAGRPRSRATQRKWSFEVKWDGVRAIAYVQPGRLRLESRNLNEITAAYPEVRGLVAALGMHEAVLDGEIVAFDDAGRPSFERLQRRMHVTAPDAVRRLMAQHAGRVRDLRPPVPRRPLADRPPVHRAPRAAGVARALRAGVARPRRAPRRRRAAARGDAEPGARGGRRQAARHPVRARPAQRRVAEDQEHAPPGDGDRRAGSRARAAAPRGSGRC